MPVTVTAPSDHRALGSPLRALVRRVLAGESRRLGEIAIVLTDDATLRALNQRWRGIGRATDVISFAYDEHERDAATRPVTGDLAISLERVHEQAARFRVSAGRELARLVIHGVLHLCGHDHARAGERRAMRAREEAALRGARGAERALDGVWSFEPASATTPAGRRLHASRPDRPTRPTARRRARSRR